MRRFGFPADVIEQWLKRDSEDELEILECNLLTVEMFQTCQLSYVAGMGGAVCLGVSMAEVRSTLHCFRVPRAQWPEVSAGVKLMALSAAKVINAR